MNQVEYKLNSDVTRFFFSIFFLIEIHRPNAMVDDDDDRPEVSLLFVVGCSTYLTLSKLVEIVSRESRLKAQETKN
jgi:hypothetical protein